MTHCGFEGRAGRGDRDDVGRAAEEFARRVAHDASRFGERLAEHASIFARNLSREWRWHRRHGLDWSGDDVRAVLKDVRAILTDVVDGVDELIERIFGGQPAPGPDVWIRVVTNREITCAGCGRAIAPGEECHLRR